MQGHGFLLVWMQMEENIWKRNAQSKFEAAITFTDTAKVKLFTAENELSSKTAVSLELTPVWL